MFNFLNLLEMVWLIIKVVKFSIIFVMMLVVSMINIVYIKLDIVLMKLLKFNFDMLFNINKFIYINVGVVV